MVTNYPEPLTATARTTAEVPCTTAEVPSRITDGLVHLMGSLGQVLCGVRGHDSVLHFEGKRLMMRCTSCGHDTPGWEISGHGPRRRYEGDARRHMISTQLVLRKSA